MQESGHLNFIKRPENALLEQSKLGFGIFFADGHTEKQMIPMIAYKGETFCFMADLLPTAGHVPLPYVMGYDTRPLLTLNEKSFFLEMAAQKNFKLILEHDAYNQIITVQNTEKGIRLNEVFSCDDLF